MEAVSNFFTWLFSDRTGVLCLLGGGILLFCLIAWLLERRTRQEYFNHEKSPDDHSLFDDLFGNDDEDEG